MAPNPDSILDSVKKVIGFDDTYTAFDLDITMFINSVFGDLQQLDAGPSSGFSIEDNTTLWSAFTTDLNLLNLIKTYMYLRVRLIFDTPATSFVIQALQQEREMLEWRINIQAEQDAAAGISVPINFFDVTDLSDFPSGAATGDWGIDFSNGNVYVCNSQTSTPGIWDLTGLSDFPDGSVVGDIGIDTTTGDIYKRDS